MSDSAQLNQDHDDQQPRESQGQNTGNVKASQENSSQLESLANQSPGGQSILRNSNRYQNLDVEVHPQIRVSTNADLDTVSDQPSMSVTNTEQSPLNLSGHLHLKVMPKKVNQTESAEYTNILGRTSPAIKQYASSRKLPQFFQPSQSEVEKKKIEQKALLLKYMNIKNSIPLAEEPDELVQNLSDFLREVGYSNSFLDPPSKNRGEIELWQVMTRAMLNPLSLESKMFWDNLVPVKEEKIRFELLQKQAQDRLKKMGDMDDGSVRNTTTPQREKQKKGDTSPLGVNKVKSDLLSPSHFNESSNANDFQIFPQITPAKNARPDNNSELKKSFKTRATKSSNNSPLQVKFQDQMTKVNSSNRKNKRSSSIKGSQEYQMKVKLALLNDVLRKKEKLRQKVNEPLSTTQQLDLYNQTLKQYTQMAKYKQYDLDIDDYLFKDEFRREALTIIGSQKAYRKMGDDILRSQERKLPGQSPVASMIRGQNQFLQEQQYKKNYSFMKHIESNKSDDDSPSRFPKLELSRLSMQPESVPQSKQSPKKWRPSNNPNFKEKADSQRGYLHESTSYKYEKRQSNMDTSRTGVNETQHSSIAETQQTFNISENLDKLRKIRQERKQVYDKERPAIYRIMDKENRNSYKKFNNMQLSSLNQTSVGVRHSADLNSFNYSPREQLLYENSNIDEINEFMNLESSSSTRLFNNPSNANAYQNLNEEEKLTLATKRTSKRNNQLQKSFSQVKPNNQQMNVYNINMKQQRKQYDDQILIEFKQQYQNNKRNKLNNQSMITVQNTNIANNHGQHSQPLLFPSFDHFLKQSTNNQLLTDQQLKEAKMSLKNHKEISQKIYKASTNFAFGKQSQNLKVADTSRNDRYTKPSKKSFSTNISRSILEQKSSDERLLMQQSNRLQILDRQLNEKAQIPYKVRQRSMMEFKKKEQNPDDSFRTNFQSVKGKSKDASI